MVLPKNPIRRNTKSAKTEPTTPTMIITLFRCSIYFSSTFFIFFSFLDSIYALTIRRRSTPFAVSTPLCVDRNGKAVSKPSFLKIGNQTPNSNIKITTMRIPSHINSKVLGAPDDFIYLFINILFAVGEFLHKIIFDCLIGKTSIVQYVCVLLRPIFVSLRHFPWLFRDAWRRPLLRPHPNL